MRTPWPRACRRRAGTRHAGNHGEALTKADGERGGDRQVHGIVIARLEPHLVDDQQNDAADDQCRTDEPWRFEQHRLDEFVRDGANDCGRQKGNQHRQHKAAGAGIARQVDKQLQQLRHVDGKNGQDRSQLDQHLKRPAGRVEAEEMTDQQQMPRG